MTRTSPLSLLSLPRCQVYTADGHHRSAAAALVGAEGKQNPNHTGKEEYNYFMAVCFQASQFTSSITIVW